MVLGKLDREMHKNETRPPSYTIYKINSKWAKDLNVRLKTINLIEGNIGIKISEISLSNIFSDTSPQARKTKENINKCTTSNKKLIAQKGKP